jgi:hypothetical protein
MFGKYNGFVSKARVSACMYFLVMLVLRAEIVTIFEPKMVTISARNTNIYNICKLCKAIFSKLYIISQPNFAILQNFITFLLAVVFDSLLFT